MENSLTICKQPLNVSFRDYPSCLASDFFKEKGFTHKQLKRLQKRLPIYYPWDSQYNTLKLIVNYRFIKFPILILMANNTHSIIEILYIAIEHNIPISLRSGSHNYEGYNIGSGFLIDQSRRKKITISFDIVNVESGALISDLIKKLSKHGLVIPTGTCANVGICGLSLGGGLGLLSRTYGLTLDNIIEFEMIDYQGKTIIANKDNNADLFWAQRGSGGGNFGIITNLTFKAHNLCEMYLYEMNFPLDQTFPVISIWQNWINTIPNTLNSELNIRKSGVEITGTFIGSEEDLRKYLNVFNIEPKIWLSSYLNMMTHYTGKTYRPPFFKCRSRFIFGFLTEPAINIIFKYMSLSTDNDRLEFNAFGGKIKEFSLESSSFVARNCSFWMQMASFWSDNNLANNRLEWINSFYEELIPHLSNYAYVNCPDSLLINYLDNYYGENLNKLIEVKRKYDPNNLFNYPQSIPV